MTTAPYAIHARPSRGRLFPEAESPTRSPWQRDRDRVIHSSGFRRLQYKTQVFINHEGDFFRTRLTHSLEVAQIARSMARHLNVDEDITEAIALAHDLGHTPFGHAGEDALSLAMETWGGFDHNTQALRQVTILERRYLQFDGLNLTWETLEGLAKHNGPVDYPSGWLRDYDAAHPLDLHTFASVEAQLAALADDIAYHGHDLDDGVKSGLLALDDLANVPIVGPALKEARELARNLPPRADPRYGAGETGEPPAEGSVAIPAMEQRLRHETVRRTINILATDVLNRTKLNLAKLDPRSADDIRHADHQVVAFSPEIADANAAIREFLFAKLYRHWKVNRMTHKARHVVAELFATLGASPGLLPDGWRDQALAATDEPARRRVVADYLASMTDRFAMEEHRRLTDLSVPG
ncbi:dGTP triphosphohydrolase [Acetobacter oeni]|uniref:Deoxyguanosinetriphosphate triphosphohydrolase-like protein n=1 Tax=Acetobacter oeni TaxID=304077 RepID=A0A511XM93_9PROT|nr:dNTP triphosphohydrolase [Acetobacter oeni]MBB3884078.1 dGTPase [Acetobacter oeni]NHO20083.1 dNTP triphosphohydrolase [Acetobacter oeni]GBR08795.1 deoxyguanosinetriphosphate triphosphohydrolase [Acetobacter oeni LMG 21952]GEN64064.1 deoxyguanosinetriphosphate triphosphohydrolase-like protein [Acetobacter oeni]